LSYQHIAPLATGLAPVYVTPMTEIDTAHAAMMADPDNDALKSAQRFSTFPMGALR